MVATLLSLKFRLTIAELKRSVARLVLWILFGLYALFLVVLVLIGLGGASTAITGHEGLAGAITVIVGSVLVAGWTLLPLVFFGSDQTLDPTRFTLFPLTGRQLAPGLVLAGVIGLPGLFTLIISIGAALPWLGTPVVMIVGVVGGILGFLMTQVGCRLASTALSGALSSRKAKDMSGLIGLILVLLLSMSGYVVSMALGLFSTDPGRVTRMLSASTTVGQVLSWTPLGAPWAMVGDAGQGQWLMMAMHLVVTCGYLGLGMWGYSVVLGKALIAPARADSAVVTKNDIIARVVSLSWASGKLVPVAAIAARCLRYWRRDPRYLGQIPAMLLMPILFTIMGMTMGSLPSDDGQTMPTFMTTGMIGFGLGFMALMGGYALSCDISYDSTAWWIHLASGVRGWQDRLGRIAGQIVWAVPLIVVVGVAVPIIVGSPRRIPATLISMAVLYLVALGISSLFSALIIYPVALPGESPLKMKTGMMGSQMLSQFGCLLISGLLSLPVCIWAVYASGWQMWLVFIVGLVWGVAILWAGIVLGGKLIDSRGPAILLTLEKNDSRVRS